MVHLLILGGSGRTGLFGVKYALEKGYQVTALVRNASALEPHKNLTIATGSVSKLEDVESAVSKAPVDGVAVFLNANRTSDMPWAKLIVPPRFITDAVGNVITALNKAKNPARLVVMSAFGVGDSWSTTPWYMRLLISHTNLGATYADHNAIDKEIRDTAGSDIEWTLARAVGLSNAGRRPIRTFAADEPGASVMVTRESCAMWMVDVAAGAEGSKFSNKAVTVSN